MTKVDGVAAYRRICGGYTLPLQNVNLGTYKNIGGVIIYRAQESLLRHISGYTAHQLSAEIILGIERGNHLAAHVGEASQIGARNLLLILEHQQ